MNGTTVVATRRIPVGAHIVELLSHGDRICAHLADGKSFEPDTLATWAALCDAAPEGGNVVDVGAYTGLFSIAAAKAGKKAIAFEPFPKNVERIHQNMRLNKVDFVVHQQAVADHQGRANFLWNKKVKGLTSGGSLVPSNNRTESIEVAAVTLDALVLENCAAIKIDVEHGEAKVLQGARQTINRCKPKIIVEVLDAKAEASIRGEMLAVDYTRAAVLDRRNWLLAPL